MKQSKLKIRAIIASLFFSMLIFSCTGQSNNPQQEPAKSSESTKEIVNKYVDTLTTAQDKAKKAAGAENVRIEEENRAAQEIEKQ
ncbi:MAG: hypothetical protein HY266_05095 [Deltaproteobacteria bacterium]|nr:hypothetical protein [Deltaproteobacteria bacterium]